jgi:hypothetical protein
LIASAAVKRREKKDREEHPEKYAAKEGGEAAALKEILHSLDIDVETAPALPPIPAKKAKQLPKAPLPPKQKERGRTVGDDFTFESNIENRQFGSEITDQHLADNIIASRGKTNRFDERYKDVPESEIWDVLDDSNSSYAARLLQRGGSRRDMILIGDIFGSPKADQM